MSWLSPRRERAVALVLAALLVLFRSLPFALFEQIQFDSDQAIFGLMAKHLARLMGVTARDDSNRPRLAVACIVLLLFAAAIFRVIAIVWGAVRAREWADLRRAAFGWYLLAVGSLAAAAYAVTFMTDERVIVASTDVARIDADQSYALSRADSVHISEQPCGSGEKIAKWYVCGAPGR
jgi:hypothetical protein